MHETKQKFPVNPGFGSHIPEHYAQVLSAAALATRAANSTPSYPKIIEAMNLYRDIEQTKRSLDMYNMGCSRIYMEPLASPDVLKNIKSLRSMDKGWMAHVSNPAIDNLESITNFNNLISVIFNSQKNFEESKFGPVSENYMANARSLAEAQRYAREFLKNKECELFEIKRNALLSGSEKLSIWKRVYNWLAKDKMDFYHKSFNEAFSESIKNIDKALQENGTTK